MTKNNQRCPNCGRIEAVGAYCSRCFTLTTEADRIPDSRGRRPRAQKKTRTSPSVD